MTHPPQPAGKGTTPTPRPHTHSLGTPPQTESPPQPIRNSKGSTSSSLPTSIFPLKTIAGGIKMVLTKHKLDDQTRNLLTKIYSYASKVAQEEANNHEISVAVALANSRLKPKLQLATIQAEPSRIWLSCHF